ncbi:GAP family protein [Micromonospora sp. WMMD812]|uniref:GAP family protein n=1 Tax=Micromonospora sp. WMMD812 TaxID=3015152 RepID=UPI00248C3939|nr:GAP family protein [Micromonospora sp. WMMD812]WBB65739.1 GAP family protein [Micromonospora sp. WMMD812]
MNFLTILPLAVVMVAGTQLVAAVLLASAERPRATSLAYLGGTSAVVLAGVTVTWLVTRVLRGLAGDAETHVSRLQRTASRIDWAVLALLVVLAVIVYLRRHETGPPRWMRRLQRATPGDAARFGAILLVTSPTDDLTMAAVGASAARHDLAWWHLLPFVLLTLALLALPLLVLLLAGRRATSALPRLRDRANRHAWVVSEVVIAFFALVTVLDLLR